MEHILDDDVFLCETWMQSDNDKITRRKNREKTIGGGVGVIVKFSLAKQKVNNFHHLNILM